MQLELKLYNTLTKQKEIFIPLDAKRVRLYVCGPTVYDRAHIGNARSTVVFDILYRIFRFSYGAKSVIYVRNITDVDDKINNRAVLEGTSISTIANLYSKIFTEDMRKLSCLIPNVSPKATEHITEMITMITKLIDHGYAYISNAHVIFAIDKYKDYGRLSRKKISDLFDGARIKVEDYKKNAGDFILWKPSSDQEPGWDSPWGYGRPGWHIECSAMSTTYLGYSFDIHGGGADLQFPHHENEIAQAKCANLGSDYAKYWLHNGFVTVNKEKMSKSLGNFINIEQAMENKPLYYGQVIRLVFMMTHYRKPLDWTDKNISDAIKVLNKLYLALKQCNVKNNDLTEISDIELNSEFISYLYDDMNLPKAISFLLSIAQRVKNNSDCSKKDALLLIKCGKIIGLFYYFEQEKEVFISPESWLRLYQSEKEVNIADLPSEQRDLANAMLSHRNNLDYQQADFFKQELESQGYMVRFDKNKQLRLFRKNEFL